MRHYRSLYVKVLCRQRAGVPLPQLWQFLVGLKAHVEAKLHHFFITFFSRKHHFLHIFCCWLLHCYECKSGTNRCNYSATRLLTLAIYSAVAGASCLTPFKTSFCSALQNEKGIFIPRHLFLWEEYLSELCKSLTGLLPDWLGITGSGTHVRRTCPIQ